MKTLKIILLILAFLALFLIPKKSTSTQAMVSEDPLSATVVIPKVQTIEEMILEIAPRFEQDPALISKISYCESKHKEVVHDGGYGLGVTGIHKKTFEGWLPLYQKEQGETLNYASSYDQLKMMSWAFSKGDSYRNQWTTYVAYKKGGTYSFYSRLLKGNFTVRCK